LLAGRFLCLSIVKRASEEERARSRLRLACHWGRTPVGEPPLPEEDRPRVEEAVHRVSAAFGGRAAWKVLPRPAAYHVSFSGVERVPERALEACANEASFVDFENKRLVVVVAKHTPDIVF
jgi:hypothetical protein